MDWIWIGIAIGVGLMVAPLVVAIATLGVIGLAVGLPVVALIYLVFTYLGSWWWVFLALAYVVCVVAAVKCRRLERERQRKMAEFEARVKAGLVSGLPADYGLLADYEPF